MEPSDDYEAKFLPGYSSDFNLNQRLWLSTIPRCPAASVRGADGL